MYVVGLLGYDDIIWLHKVINSKQWKATNIWEAHSPSTFRKKLHPENAVAWWLETNFNICPTKEKVSFLIHATLEIIYLALNEVIAKRTKYG